MIGSERVKRVYKEMKVTYRVPVLRVEGLNRATQLSVKFRLYISNQLKLGLIRVNLDPLRHTMRLILGQSNLVILIYEENSRHVFLVSAQALLQLGKERNSRLEDALRLYKFFGDVEEEEIFIKEAEKLMASKEVGKDLTSLTRLQQRHEVSQ